MRLEWEKQKVRRINTLTTLKQKYTTVEQVVETLFKALAIRQKDQSSV